MQSWGLGAGSPGLEGCCGAWDQGASAVSVGFRRLRSIRPEPGPGVPEPFSGSAARGGPLRADGGPPRASWAPSGPGARWTSGGAGRAQFKPASCRPSCRACSGSTGESTLGRVGGSSAPNSVWPCHHPQGPECLPWFSFNGTLVFSDFRFLASNRFILEA